jgi:hypothetical protein
MITFKVEKCCLNYNNRDVKAIVSMLTIKFWKIWQIERLQLKNHYKFCRMVMSTLDMIIYTNKSANLKPVLLISMMKLHIMTSFYIVTYTMMSFYILMS